MRIVLPSLALLSMISVAAASPVIIMPDSTNNRLVSFSPVDGSVVNSNLFALPSGVTPISAIQVGSQIWVSEQVGDKISRFDFSGVLVGTSGVGVLDNVRGITLIGNTVYAANDGTLFGAGDTVVRFDTSGTHLGNLNVASNNTSPFYVYSFNGNLLTSSSVGNDDMHIFDTSGASVGTFYNGTNSFAEQIDRAADNSLLVAWFTSNRVSKHDPATGAELSSFAASGARGVYQLQNGNIMWSSGSGVRVYDTLTATSTLVYSGGGRFFSLADLPGVNQDLTGTLNLSDTSAAFATARSIGYSVVQGTSTIASGSVSQSSPSGAFSLSVPASASGAASVVFDGSSFLKKTVSVNLTGSNQAIGTVALQNGDVDNSGEVDAADIDAVIAAFGDTSAGTTDVDVSGEVDAADIDIVIANFGGVDG